MQVIRLSGKAEQVFKYLEILTDRYGDMTLAQLQKHLIETK